MASILDQYEQASQSSQRPKPVTEPMVSSGYINMQLEDYTPMFSKKRMMLKNLKGVITHAAVANDSIVLAMHKIDEKKKLFRLDLKNSNDHGEGITCFFLLPTLLILNWLR